MLGSADRSKSSRDKLAWFLVTRIFPLSRVYVGSLSLSLSCHQPCNPNPTTFPLRLLRAIARVGGSVQRPCDFCPPVRAGAAPGRSGHQFRPRRAGEQLLEHGATAHVIPGALGNGWTRERLASPRSGLFVCFCSQYTYESWFGCAAPCKGSVLCTERLLQ